jgi:CubicO group peptidase (beta-lactamase class C family)
LKRRLACALLAGLSGPATATQELAPAAPELRALVDELDALRQSHRVPAFALTLVDSERVLWSGARGVADLATARPASADTLFRIGSITKAFTALALLDAEVRGRLSLEDRLKDRAPDAPLANPWSAGHPVRLVHLLEHTAGLLDLTRDEFDHNTPLSLEAGLRVAPEARVVRWPPGLHASYSNAGPGLAGYALERATGERYEDLVKRRVLAPLGMHSATLELDHSTRERLATGYDSDGETPIPYWHMVLRPFGAINASPREMSAFVQLFLGWGRVGGRQVFGRPLIERMEVPHTTLAARSGLRFGYGLGNYAYVHKGLVFHGHGGDADGYLSHYGYNRDTGLGYFLVINAFKKQALRAMRRSVQDYIVAGAHPPKPPPRASVAADRLAALTGRYRAVTWRFPWTDAERIEEDEVRVGLRDGTLYLEPRDARAEALVPVTPRHFRQADEPVATLAFIEHEGGLYLQGDLGNYRRVSPDVKAISERRRRTRGAGSDLAPSPGRLGDKHPGHAGP